MKRTLPAFFWLFFSLVPHLASADDPQLIRQVAGAAGMKIDSLAAVDGLPGFHSSGHWLLFRFEGDRVELDRQYNVVEEVLGLTKEGSQGVALLRQGPHRWNVTRLDPNAVVGAIRFRRAYKRRTDAPAIEVRPQQVASFPACFAELPASCEKLQFEPLAYKNTVGYWVNAGESPHWNYKVTQPLTCRVRILQGCGRGQGGSQVTLDFGSTSLDYRVRETGQFQAFRWFDAGEVEFKSAQEGQVRIVVKKLARNAVMDVREIRLEPVLPDRGQQSRPNVVIFYTDDQGTLDLNCYGSRDLHTPNMDGLAHEGVRFTQAYAHTVCCPSRAMLMTGRVPQRSNVNNWTQGNAKGRPGRNMNLDEKTIAEYLKENGYRTALFGKWHLGAATTHGPTRQGFDEFFGLRGGFIDNFNHFFLHGTGFHDLYEGTEEVFRKGEYFPDLVTQRSLKFLESAGDSPFFLCVPFNIPHYPEQADPVFAQRYANLKQPRQNYAKIVSTTDERIGQVLRKLDELRYRENTIVIFMSDNGHSPEDYAIQPDNHASGLPPGHKYGAGGGGGNTGKWIGAKGSFLEGGIRVPAIISFPKRLPRGIVRNQPITACDWLPTIMDLCGVSIPGKMKLDGQSLLPILLKNAPTHHEVMHWQWQNRWAVRKGGWKLSGGSNKVSLHSLVGDRPETVDFASEKPELVKELRSLHEAWLAEVMPGQRSNR
ncbi:MAG: sulfatase-like hydrolase/transferase [Planctomycetota bacterium]|nr:sulfatase-like hydrolase/transferase [Planctomycetota bacterium]